MNFSLSDEQRLLRSTARAWFQRHESPDTMRAMLDGRTGGPQLADAAATGYLALAVAEDAGGSGMTVLDLAVVAEEAGRRLSAVPLAAVAEAAALLSGADDPAAADLLRAVAAGTESVAVVGERELRISRQGDAASVEGTSALTAYAAGASTFLLPAASQVCVLVVEAGRGVHVEPAASLDPTRAAGTVTFYGATAARVIPVRAGVAAHARDIAMTVIAAEDLGGASRALELAVEYARDRIAFGRSIGTFQAVKHACVDAFVQVEQLRSLVWFAAWAADADPARFDLAAPAAKALAAQAFEDVTATCIQVHGGIGYTWEHDAHLYWRRARLDASLHARAGELLDRVADLALEQPQLVASR